MELRESLTTDLSRLSGSFVIARNTAFTFKGKKCRRPGNRQVASLGSAMCLKGLFSVTPAACVLNVQLIDAEKAASTSGRNASTRR